MSGPIILVTGATGRQGGAVIRALLASSTSFQILALTRDTTSPSSLKLAKLGIRLIQGNQDDTNAIFASAGGPIDGVFSTQVPDGKGQNEESEIRQGCGMWDAAQKAGVKHFVLTSADRHGFQPTPIPHFASKHAIEEHIMKTSTPEGTKWTFLRPVTFMENLVKGFQGRVFFTFLEAYVGAEIPVQLIAVEDVGKFAAIAFENPTEYANKALSLAGDTCTLRQMQGIYFAHTHSNPKATFHVVACILLEHVIPNIGIMMKWLKEIGFGADVEECRRVLPEVMTLEEWAGKNLKE